MTKPLSTKLFITRSSEIWGNQFDYSNTIYKNSYSKVTIVCKLHGEFQQMPSNHLRYGCGKCGRSLNNRNCELKKKCGSEFSYKASQIHENKYDYSESVYTTACIKLIVICKVHGRFNVSPNNHLRGKGCPKCGLIISSTSKVKSFDEYYPKFKEIHCEKYDYSCVEWKNASTHITVICKVHGQFRILPLLHRNGSGCSKCSNRYSAISVDWLLLMAVKYSTTIQHAQHMGEFMIPGTRYKSDGYSKSLNIIFEFHGDFWHGNPKIYDQESINPRVGVKYGSLYGDTLEKANVIRSKGYNLIEVWEADWKKFIKCIRVVQKKWRSII